MRNLYIGIAVVVALAVAALFYVYGNPLGLISTNPATNTMLPEGQGASNSGLVVQDQTVGTGDTAQPGDTLTVNYTGKLQDGTVFDTSVGKQPFQFVLGAGSVIPGWDQGLVGMKVGGTRTLVIPPNLAYGAQAVGPIPANSTLVFEVQLISVEHASSTPAH